MATTTAFAPTKDLAKTDHTVFVLQALLHMIEATVTLHTTQISDLLAGGGSLSGAVIHDGNEIEGEFVVVITDLGA